MTTIGPRLKMWRLDKASVCWLGNRYLRNFFILFKRVCLFDQNIIYLTCNTSLKLIGPNLSRDKREKIILLSFITLIFGRLHSKTFSSYLTWWVLLLYFNGKTLI